MEHSQNFDKVMKWYGDGVTGLWTKKQVYNAVGRWITAEEYLEITGEEYVA